MGLDNYPVPCECGEHPRRNGIPKGFTHRTEDSCPFQDEGFPIGIMGSCCWLRGKAAARELAALGNDDLSCLMHEDMSAERAIDFAAALRVCADFYERIYAKDLEKPKGAGWNGRWDSEQNALVYETHSTLEKAVASIREAALWYEKVGRLGFGVHAWY